MALSTESGTERPKVSAIVTCYNEETNLPGCIESLLWCDEILVVDSFSTDRSPEIARGYDKVRFFQRPYLGGASQKNWAIDRARFEWIVILDADERCTPALQDEIESLLLAGPKFNAYIVRRRAFFVGQRIRFCGWRGDHVRRLFRAGTAYYQNRRVHARLVTSGPAPWLRNHLDHYMVDRVDEYLSRLTRYGYWGAAQSWVDGKRTSWAQVFLRSFWRLFRNYIVYFGFLDGRRGLVFCTLQAYATFVKYSILWGWQVNATRGIEPDLPEFDRDEEVWSGLGRVKAGRAAPAPVESEPAAVEASPAAVRQTPRTEPVQLRRPRETKPTAVARAKVGPTADTGTERATS